MILFSKYFIYVIYSYKCEWKYFKTIMIFATVSNSETRFQCIKSTVEASK